MYTLKIDDPDKLFFTSDTHFGHFNICKYCHRPFDSRSEMDQTLIDNWNSVVPADGIVVHCGDFMLAHNDSDLEKCMKEYMKYLGKLNGRILLVRGNHDVIDLLQTNEKLISTQDKAIIKVDGIRICANHEPLSTWVGDYHVFGHIHTLSDGTCYGLDGDVTKKLRPTQYDVGVDQNGYKPISYWELCDIFRNRAKKD